MVLIDTSAWIEAMRQHGDAEMRVRVNEVIRAGTAAWCPAVRMELWPCAKGRRELDRLMELRELVFDLPISDEVWERAIKLATMGRSKGLKCPISDLLIFACAEVHRVTMLHCDKHFDLLVKL